MTSHQEKIPCVLLSFGNEQDLAKRFSLVSREPVLEHKLWLHTATYLKTPRKDQDSYVHSGHRSLLHTDYWECTTSSDNKSVLSILGCLRTGTSKEASQPCNVNARSSKPRPASPHACKSLFIPYFSFLFYVPSSLKLWTLLLFPLYILASHSIII